MHLEALEQNNKSEVSESLIHVGTPRLVFAAFILVVTAVVSADVSPFPVSPVQPVELGTATPPSLLLVHSPG